MSKLSDHFKNNQRCIMYAQQTGKLRVYMDIYALHAPNLVFQLHTSVMTVNVKNPQTISDARLTMIYDCELQVIMDMIKDIFCYIYAVEPKQLPLKINEQSVYGDIARSIMEGKISREYLKDDWGSFTLPQFS